MSDSTNERTFPAHALKPGDTIAGVEIADFPRRHLRGGWFLPMADGSERRIPSLDTPVTVGW